MSDVTSLHGGEQVPVVRATAVTRHYQTGSQTVRALDGADFTIGAGEFVAIMGPSGSGKSTLMNLIGGLDVPTSGTMEVMGHDVARLSPNRLAEMRNSCVGFVFQQFNLLPRTTALRQVMLPLAYGRAGRREAEKRAWAALSAVDLTERMDHLPSQLSGGQQQRVAIARALVNNPPVLLADEPTGALDSRTALEIMKLFTELNRRGQTVIVVTHDRDTAAYAGRVLTCKDGRIVSDEVLRARREEEEAA